MKVAIAGAGIMDLSVMSGFSSHGFKFGVLMGEAVADGIEGRREPGELARRAAGAAV